MGAGGSVEDDERERMSVTMRKRFYTEYQEVRTEYERNFGEAKIYKKKSTENYYLFKRRVFDSEDEVEKFINDLKVIKSIDHPNICKIIFFNCKANREF